MQRHLLLLHQVFWRVGQDRQDAHPADGPVGSYAWRYNKYMQTTCKIDCYVDDPLLAPSFTCRANPPPPSRYVTYISYLKLCFTRYERVSVQCKMMDLWAHYYGKEHKTIEDFIRNGKAPRRDFHLGLVFSAVQVSCTQHVVHESSKQLFWVRY